MLRRRDHYSRTYATSAPYYTHHDTQTRARARTDKKRPPKKMEESKATETRVNGLTGQTAAAAASVTPYTRVRSDTRERALQSNDPRTCFLERYTTATPRTRN